MTKKCIKIRLKTHRAHTANMRSLINASYAVRSAVSTTDGLEGENNVRGGVNTRLVTI